MTKKNEEKTVKWLSNDYKIVGKKDQKSGKKKILIFVDLPDGSTVALSLYENYCLAIFEGIDKNQKAS